MYSLLCLAVVLVESSIVLGDKNDFSPHVWAVRLSDNDHHSVAEKAGLTSLGKVFSDVHEFRLSKTHHENLRNRFDHDDDAVLKHVHTSIITHPSVTWAERQIPLRRVPRSSGNNKQFDDPSYVQQWHLVNDLEEGHDINVTGVWSLNITGYGVTVAVVDDGLEYNNPEIQNNYNSRGSYDFNNDDYDPRPDTTSASNSHGTRCAGLVAAVANNSLCGVGVAFKSQVSGIRLLDGTITDLLEAKSLTYKTHINYIYSCSWGPTDDGVTVEAPGTLAQLALQLGTETGRHGYGSIFIFASGNGGSREDNCNFDGYANSIYTVTIGAVDELDRKPYYAEECASKFAVTYSNGVRRGDRNIVTADLLRNNGCTASFSGTSAAAPMAAGIIALALQVRSCLTWHDVQSLLVYTARPIDFQEVEWTTNGCGFRHSHQHGFGVLDAYRLTAAAQIWPLLPNTISWSSQTLNVNSELPYTKEWLVSNITVEESDLPPGLITLEHVAISVTIEHEYRGAVVIDLVSPSQTISHMATYRSNDKSNHGFNDWVFTTVRYWGEVPYGVWSIRVLDNVSIGFTKEIDASRGKLIQWRLLLRGVNVTKEDIENRKKLVEAIVSNSSYTPPIPCPPPPTNVPDITFAGGTSSNKLLQISSAVGAVIVTLVLVHIILSFIIQRCRNRNIYVLATLPSVPYYRHNSSCAEEEEVLLLPDLSSANTRNKESGATDWENDEDVLETEEDSMTNDTDTSSSRRSLTDHHHNTEL